MKLFINSGVCERKWNGNVEISELDNGMTELKIPNYLENESREEYITFILPCSPEDLEKDLLLEQVSLHRANQTAYRINQKNIKNDKGIYALVRSTETIPDDVYIPAAMKDRVTVIRRIRFIDDEVDYGDFLSNVYLIKVKLQMNETLPVYMTYADPYAITEQYVFYRDSFEYGVTKKFETFIYVNNINKRDFISLSQL